MNPFRLQQIQFDANQPADSIHLSIYVYYTVMGIEHGRQGLSRVETGPTGFVIGDVIIKPFGNQELRKCAGRIMTVMTTVGRQTLRWTTFVILNGV